MQLKIPPYFAFCSDTGGLIAAMVRKFNKYSNPFFKAKGPLAAPAAALIGAAIPNLHEAVALHQQGILDQASAIYRKLLKFEPQNADALHLLGLIAYQTGSLQESVLLISEAIEINPNDANFYSNRASALIGLKQFEDAIFNCNQAISLKNDFAQAYTNRGLALKELHQFEEAIENYDTAIAYRPDLAEAYSNRAIVLLALKQFEVALTNCNQAIKLKPDFANAYSNRGIALHALNKINDAIVSYGMAISLDPSYAEAFSNRGSAFEELKQFEAALADYQTAMNLNPNIEYLFGTVQHIKMQICDWTDFNQNVFELSRKIQANEKASPCLTVLALNTSLADQHQAASIWVMDKYPKNLSLGPIPKRPNQPKIRIGYYSADFYNHATSYLMAELFEMHDKDQFELIAFSFNSNNKDQMHSRVSQAFDRYIEVAFMSDKEVAQMSRELEIDIAIDLKGLTQNERFGIFAYQAAPIQVSYLGYPGTLGSNYIDYVIADETIIPKDSQRYYAEKIIYMPHTYQVNDRSRVIASTHFSKQELGLPEEVFVFCCFNNNYKIYPPVFDLWVKILKAVDHSVLWLLEDNVTASINLSKEAQSRGLDPSRLVFAKRMDMSSHLARQKVADLFLDTLPYNAHTTASDALWAGLPVLTCMGDTFAGRVAASLLFSIGLPELVTETLDEYESLAIELATNSEKLKSIQVKLKNNRLSTPLFNTPLFTKHIELGYKKIYEQYQSDLPPEHVYIDVCF